MNTGSAVVYPRSIVSQWISINQLPSADDRDDAWNVELKFVGAEVGEFGPDRGEDIDIVLIGVQ